MEDLNSIARAIPKEQRKRILIELQEKELHIALKELFQKLEPNYIVEITHGSEELGKDLVIVKEDKFTWEAIGVIVKRGDIRGTTLREVDQLKERVGDVIETRPLSERKLEEIKSQIHQAKTHPAKLKSTFKELRVNKVYIVLAGNISSNARERLSKELPGDIVIFDINWLVDKFTDTYPQVFFESIATDFITNLIVDLEKKHMLIKKNMNLSDYFVEPIVVGSETPLELDEKSLKIHLRQKKIPFLMLKSLLQANKRILLVGEPGCGKSAALAKLAIDEYKTVFTTISKKTQGRKIEIPLLIQAKDLKGLESKDALLKKFLVKDEIINKFKICALFIDALDETLPEERPEIIKNISSLSQDLSCAILITSRNIETIETILSGYDRYDLMPFEFSQAIRLVNKLFDDKKLVESIRDGLNKIKHEIPFFPLSLMLLVDLVEEHKEIPASITELYDRFFDFNLGRFDKEKGITVLFEYLIKKKFLSDLAFQELFKKNRLEIPKSDFDAFLKAFSELYAWDSGKLKYFISEIERSGIISIRDVVFFRHRSFLDYFVGYCIYDRRDEITNLKDMMTDVYFNEIWSEVAFFYIGLKREISAELLEQIFNFNKEKSLSTISLKYLVGRLLQAGWNTPTSIKKMGIEKAIAYNDEIKNRLLSAIEKDKDIPRIIADIFLIRLAEWAYSSGFIANESLAIIDRVLEEEKSQNIKAIIPLFKAVGRFLEQLEIDKRVEKIMELCKKLPAEDEASALVFLLLLNKKEKAIEKAIRRRLNHLANKHKKLFSRLLPVKKKGF